MYSYVTYSVKLHNILMVLMEISLILELWIFFSRLIRSAGLKKIMRIGILFLMSFVLMCFFLNDHRYQIGENNHPSFLLKIPIWIFLAGMSLLIICLCLLVRNEILTCRKNISAWSVKETMDDVPCGVCVSDSWGRIVLSNKKMRELSRMLIGAVLQNYEDLKQVLDGNKSVQGVTRLSPENSVLYLPNGTVWMFQNYMLTEEEVAGYLQTVAFDVTEIYFNSEKIRMKNEKLELLNQKLKKMYEQIDESIREQETLKMKMQVHDSFGRSLLTIRRMLEGNKEPDYMKNQLEILKQSVYILSGIMQDDTEKQYEESIKHAEKLGVSVEIEGELCDEYQVALITDKAIRECITNCIRHAHGRRVYVQSHKTREGWKVCITNDGERPKEGCREGGGLSALREVVERDGGEMTTKFEPEFLLALKLPFSETEEE
ncbi:ATP-binding protein [Ruminococcus sp.]|uniref:ATP-binding protein n=1 Tax=Ruminococcus sp. TaxID=41978 RepID=UPI0035296FB0